MEYVKIRADFKYAEKGRFYRTVLVPKGIGLFELGCHLVHVFEGTLEHCFLFTYRRTQFVPAAFLEEDLGISKWLWMGQYTIDDLPDTFDFEYDTGDGWDFRCKKYKRTVTREGEDEELPRIIILEGAGQGIWEDNIGTLYAYLAGELDPNSYDEDPENGIYHPWNVSLDCWGDFDKPLDMSLAEESEDVLWEEGWKEELSLARELDLDSMPKDEDPFDMFNAAGVRSHFTELFAETFAHAYGYSDVYALAESLYGPNMARKKFTRLVTEQLGHYLSEKDIAAIFAAVEKKLRQ